MVTPGVLSVMEGQDPVLRRATRSGDAWEMDLPDPADIRRALTGLAAADVHVSKFEHIRPSLHEIFVDHVGQAKVAERRPEEARVTLDRAAQEFERLGVAHLSDWAKALV